MLLAISLANYSEYLIPGILLAVIIVYAVYTIIKKRKYQSEIDELYDNIKIGDKVKLYNGIFGEVVSIREALDGTLVVVIKTGDAEHQTYLECDMGAIYAIDDKDEVQEDENDKKSIENSTAESTEKTSEELEKTSEELEKTSEELEKTSQEKKISL